jgi:thioredoxin 1
VRVVDGSLDTTADAITRSGEGDGQATVGKVHVDDNPRLAAPYGIRSIPTVLLFQGGQVVDQTVGVVPKQVLTEKLRALVSAAA